MAKNSGSAFIGQIAISRRGIPPDIRMAVKFLNMDRFA